MPVVVKWSFVHGVDFIIQQYRTLKVPLPSPISPSLTNTIYCLWKPHYMAGCTAQLGDRLQVATVKSAVNFFSSSPATDIPSREKNVP